MCFIAIVVLVSATISCNTSTYAEQAGSNRLNIVATTGMIADVVLNITKDSADVSALMGPGVDPHLYKATQGDLKRLKEANIVYYNGLHLEGKLGDIFVRLGKIQPVEAVSDNISRDILINNSTMGGQYDPHIWFDVSLWRQVALYVNQSLCKHDSINAAFYHRNTRAYLTRLDELHGELKEQIASIPREQRILITAHDAFGYFGRAYKIEVKGLQGISTLSEFGLKDVTDLVNFITDKKIKAVFVESSVPEKYIRSVVEGCHEKGHNVAIGGILFSDAMGNEGTTEGTYIGMVRANAKTIVEALK